MQPSGSWIHEKTRLDLVEQWFGALVAANDRLLDEANRLIYTPCDGESVTPNEKIRRLELLTACVRHNARLAERGEKLRAEIFKDPPEQLAKYRAQITICEKRLLEMPKAGF